MDVSNIIYPFGLAFTGLFFVLKLTPLVGAVIAHYWQNPAGTKSSSFVIYAAVILFVCAVPSLLIPWLPEAYRLDPMESILVSSVGTTLVFATWAFIQYHRDQRKLRHAWLYLLVFVNVALISYNAGFEQADYQAFRTPTFYRITDKYGFDTYVRMIRTSSAGFLVASDRKVFFIPKEEVRRVELEIKPTD